MNIDEDIEDIEEDIDLDVYNEDIDSIQHLHDLHNLLRILTTQPDQPQQQPIESDTNTNTNIFSNIFTNLVRSGIRTYLGYQEPHWFHQIIRYINSSGNSGSNSSNTRYNGRTKIFENEPGEEKECPICYEQYVTNDKIALTACNHHFHIQCIEKWIDQTYNCPVCRSTIL